MVVSSLWIVPADAFLLGIHGTSYCFVLLQDMFSRLLNFSWCPSCAELPTTLLAKIVFLLRFLLPGEGAFVLPSFLSYCPRRTATALSPILPFLNRKGREKIIRNDISNRYFDHSLLTIVM